MINIGDATEGMISPSKIATARRNLNGTPGGGRTNVRFKPKTREILSKQELVEGLIAHDKPTIEGQHVVDDIVVEVPCIQLNNMTPSHLHLYDGAD